MDLNSFNEQLIQLRSETTVKNHTLSLQIEQLNRQIHQIINFQNVYSSDETGILTDKLRDMNYQCSLISYLSTEVQTLRKELEITHQCLKLHDIDIDKYKQSLELIDILDKDNREDGNNVK